MRIQIYCNLGTKFYDIEPSISVTHLKEIICNKEGISKTYLSYF